MSPLSNAPGRWQAVPGQYTAKLRTSAEVAALVEPGSRIFISSGAGEPQTVVAALNERLGHTEDTEIIHVLTLGLSPYDREPFSRNVRYSAMFIGPNIREAVQQGRGDYIPVFFSEMPALFRSKRMRLDFAIVSASPPDAHGYMSLGVSVDAAKAAAECAKVVIAEVNAQMPRTMGDCSMHVSQVHHIVESDVPVLELKHPEPDDVALRIGRRVSALIEDGSTIQAGIGTIPDAVMSLLDGKNDLGIHTEMFSDGLVDLVRKGNVTCRRKTLHKGKAVTSFCMGTRRLYDFVDNNPFVEFHPIEHTNDPFMIAQNDRMVAVNGALQVDLTGQVVADSIGYYLYSGFGGQVDFIRGAARSRGGKPIIVLPSTAREGKVSRIVATLPPGAGVVTSRADVHYVITEHGTAYLHGKSLRERAMQLISVAHPDFRDGLLEEAKDLGYIPRDQLPLTPAGRYYPEQYERRAEFKGGLSVLFRPIKTTDEPLERALFYSLSDETVYLRFFSYLKALPHEKLQHLVNIDYQDEMAIVGITGPPEDEEMVAIARYNRDPAANFAEAAIVIRDEYQDCGLGTWLMGYLAEIARGRGIYGFTADVLTRNRKMLHVMLKLGFKVESSVEENAYSLRMKF